MYMNCPKCGKVIDANWENCPQCGLDIKEYSAMSKEEQLKIKTDVRVERVNAFTESILDSIGWRIAMAVLVLGLLAFVVWTVRTRETGDGASANKPIADVEDSYVAQSGEAKPAESKDAKTAEEKELVNDRDVPLEEILGFRRQYSAINIDRYYCCMRIRMGAPYTTKGSEIQEQLKDSTDERDKDIVLQDIIREGHLANDEGKVYTAIPIQLCFADYCNWDANNSLSATDLMMYGRGFGDLEHYNYFLVMHVELPKDFTKDSETGTKSYRKTPNYSQDYSIHDSGDYNVQDYDDPGVFADDWWDEFEDEEEDGWGLAYDYWEEYH